MRSFINRTQVSVFAHLRMPIWEISDKDENVLILRGYTFGIWGMIYVSL